MIILKWLCFFIDILCVNYLSSDYIMVWSVAVEPKCYHWKECVRHNTEPLSSTCLNRTPPSHHQDYHLISFPSYSYVVCVSCLHLTNFSILVILAMKPLFKRMWTANSLFLCCRHFLNFKLLYISSIKKFSRRWKLILSKWLQCHPTVHGSSIRMVLFCW